jgi:hypothetical protein
MQGVGSGAECQACVCFARSRRVCALAWWLRRVASSQMPAALERRDEHCPPKASACRWFAPPGLTLKALEQGIPTPRQLAHGVAQVLICPVPLCAGTLDLGEDNRGCCFVCGARIRRRGNGDVEVQINPHELLPARIEQIVGFVPEEIRQSQDLPRRRRAVFMEPDYEIGQLNRAGVTLVAKAALDRRRWHRYRWRELHALLAPPDGISSSHRASLIAHGIAVVEYDLPNPVQYLEPTPEIAQAVMLARENPVWLWRFNLALALSQFTRTVEVAEACGAPMEEVTNVLFAQLDLLVDGLGRWKDAGRLTRNLYRQCEGRMSLVREAYVRDQLRVRLGNVFGAVGRSAARKVEVEEGESRSAAQSCFDAAKNWMHRALRLRLRVATANVGFGWRASWLFNHRLAGLGLHLDLEEVPKMAGDRPVVQWFRAGVLRKEHFVVGRDRYLIPTYSPAPAWSEWLREQVAKLLEIKRVWYDGAYRRLEAAHERHVASLCEALLAQNPNAYEPLVYLPEEVPEQARGLLRQLGSEARHRLAANPALQSSLEQVLGIWEEWIG